MLVDRAQLEREPSSAATIETEVDGLLGAHPRIQNGTLRSRLDELLARLDRFRTERRARVPRVPRAARRRSSTRERKRLRLDEFTPRVLTSFVRNRLIDEVYLPLVGANLAKQLGAAGDEEAHRPDGHAAAHLAARLRQDDAHGVRREPARARRS